MAEELVVTLNRGDSSGFGFSLLGTAGLPHVIYDIIENSPAAKSGKNRSIALSELVSDTGHRERREFRMADAE
ncbi:PH and SEC7 domain-containing protein [Anthophora plagiata]